jgi:hypothetical protein
LFGQTHGFYGDDGEAGFVDAGQDFALLTGSYRVGFDDCEGAFERQGKIPPVSLR